MSPCLPLVDGGRVVGRVCVPRAWEVYKVETVPDRWCFGCRKRGDVTWTLSGEEMPSYYAPTWEAKCANCGQINGDLGFGRERDGGDE